MHSLVGVWKLIEVRAFDDAGRELPSPLGPEPMGVATFGAERAIVSAGDGRVTLPPEVSKRVFAAYCGRYTFDGTKYVCQVDGASSPDMFVDQVRHVRFDGPTRMTVIPVSRLFGQSGGLEMLWERVG
jgi:hypothetical protein